MNKQLLEKLYDQKGYKEKETSQAIEYVIKLEKFSQKFNYDLESIDIKTITIYIE